MTEKKGLYGRNSRNNVDALPLVCISMIMKNASLSQDGSKPRASTIQPHVRPKCPQTLPLTSSKWMLQSLQSAVILEATQATPSRDLYPTIQGSVNGDFTRRLRILMLCDIVLGGVLEMWRQRRKTHPALVANPSVQLLCGSSDQFCFSRLERHGSNNRPSSNASICRAICPCCLELLSQV